MGRESRTGGPLSFAAGGVPIIGEGARNPLARPPQVRDMAGRVLHEGDMVIVHTGNPQYFRVERIEPHVEDGVPPGHMKITMSCVALFSAERDVRNFEFTRIAVAPTAPAPPSTESDTQITKIEDPQ